MTQTSGDERSLMPDSASEAPSDRNPFEEALAGLVAQIRAGALPHGTRLPPERDLSEQLGISRTTMRAVIRALQQVGYVRTQRGRAGGSFVIWEPSANADRHDRLSEQMKDRLRDMVTFRSVLEPGAAALAAEADLSEEQRGELRERLAAASLAGPAFRLADAELHGCIAQLSGCRALVDSIANVQLILNETLLQVVPVIGPALEHSHEQHGAIVDAILAGDPERAREVMRTHVDATAELVRSFLS
ncbi:FCD domain-containing protein [Streptomyces sp. NPDC047042]|uniref:FadR/GntR family transcriptional regulator n=1 Tax=Streptomyces sp. NPDC047042 TaxID=3154807 RepID=UPI0033FCC5DC